jgi:pSer/pThr/pTyr-binding forkhead associated (FHA) protein
LAKGRRASERRREKEGEDPFPTADEAAPGDVTVRAPLHEGSELPQDKHQAIATGRLELGLPEKTTPDGVLEDDEKTEVKQRGILTVPRGAQLQDLQSMETWPLLTTPAIVGRAPDADLVFELMPQLSREHLKFTLMEDQPTWLIEDLGSTSGTLLNGELLELPSLIKHGDHIIAGTTEFRFMWHDQEPVQKVVTAEVASPADDIGEATGLTQVISSPLAVSSNLKAVFAFLGVALTGLALTVVLLWPTAEKNPHIIAQVEQLLRDSREHMDEMSFKKAQEALDTIVLLDPKNGKAESLQKMIDGEIESKGNIDKAKTLKARKKLKEMKAVLSRIPDSSLWAPLRDKMIRSAKSTKREERLNQVRGLIQSGNIDSAKKFLIVYVKEYPEDKKAKELRKEISQIENRPPPRDEILEKAQGMFRAGELSGAKIFSEAKAAKGNEKMVVFSEDLIAFNKKWRLGKKQLSQKKGKKASQNLRAAYGIAFELAGMNKSVPQTQVGHVWADALYLVGLIELRAGRNCGWAKAILRATELRPDDPKTAAQRRKIQRQAQAALQRAKAKRSIHPQEAAAIVRDNLCFVPKGTPLRTQYEKFLKE